MRKWLSLGRIQAIYSAFIIALLLAFILVEALGAFDYVNANLLQKYPATIISGLLIAIFGGIGIIQNLTASSVKQNTKLFTEVRDYLKEDTLRQLDLARSKMQGSHQDILLGQEIDDLLRRVREWLSQGYFEIIGRDPFQEFWTRNIRACKGAHIRASALASPNYFFDAGDINNAIKYLIDNGGSMERIFVVPPTWQEDENTINMLEHQIELGVWVRVLVEDEKVPATLVDSFILYDAKLPEQRLRDMTPREIEQHEHYRFGWEVLTARRSVTITRCRVFWSRDKIVDMEKSMDRLLELSVPYREESWRPWQRAAL